MLLIQRPEIPHPCFPLLTAAEIPVTSPTVKDPLKEKRRARKMSKKKERQSQYTARKQEEGEEDEEEEEGTPGSKRRPR